ncbi:BspA family leucine-rich repeat surface protein [Apilactobacillus quenuiae]|uniref:BspA family leucine-rich repeat surface protein n=1 Tax=Apilactobacillus quenuiae TaxID=2008377 RepID=UPI000D01466E|nr:BspA family leucine-rich repeat surface protein [Apilactobacillus quenuiae]
MLNKKLLIITILLSGMLSTLTIIDASANSANMTNDSVNTDTNIHKWGNGQWNYNSQTKTLVVSGEINPNHFDNDLENAIRSTVDDPSVNPNASSTHIDISKATVNGQHIKGLGVWGTAPLLITEDDKAYVGSGNLNYMFAYSKLFKDIPTDANNNYEYQNVKSINLTDKVVAPADSHGLFVTSNPDSDKVNITSNELSEINGLSNLDTSNVTNMFAMFYNLYNLKSLDLSHFDTSKVNDMSFMFYVLPNLRYLNVSSFNTSKVKNMTAMFYELLSLDNLDVSNFDTSSNNNKFTYMFYRGLFKSLNLGGSFSLSGNYDQTGLFFDGGYDGSYDNNYSNYDHYSPNYPLGAQPEKIILGSNVEINSNSGFAQLPVPSNDYTGKFLDSNNKIFSSDELSDGKNHSGTYYAQLTDKAESQLGYNDAIKSMIGQKDIDPTKFVLPDINEKSKIYKDSFNSGVSDFIRGINDAKKVFNKEKVDTDFSNSGYKNGYDFATNYLKLHDHNNGGNTNNNDHNNSGNTNNNDHNNSGNTNNNDHNNGGNTNNNNDHNNGGNTNNNNDHNNSGNTNNNDHNNGGNTNNNSDHNNSDSTNNIINKKTLIGSRIYAIKGLNLYSKNYFSPKYKIMHFSYKKRTNRPMFKILGYVFSSKGDLRYKVVMIDSKTGRIMGKHNIGYITAKDNYVEPLYYSKDVRKVRVIANKIISYRKPTLKQKIKTFKKGKILIVKSVIKNGTVYRLKLSDHSYITANKRLVIKVH